MNDLWFKYVPVGATLECIDSGIGYGIGGMGFFPGRVFKVASIYKKFIGRDDDESNYAFADIRGHTVWEKVCKPKYVEGDWVITKNYSSRYDGKALKIDRINEKYCYFSPAEESNHSFHITNIDRYATKEEIALVTGTANIGENKFKIEDKVVLKKGVKDSPEFPFDAWKKGLEYNEEYEVALTGKYTWLEINNNSEIPCISIKGKNFGWIPMRFFELAIGDNFTSLEDSGPAILSSEDFEWKIIPSKDQECYTPQEISKRIPLFTGYEPKPIVLNKVPVILKVLNITNKKIKI